MAEQILESETFKTLTHICILGVMGIATNTGDAGQIHKEFRHLVEIFEILKQKYFAGQDYFREISMGMSGDYRIAVEEGSTLVRIGSSVFVNSEYITKN